MPSVPNFDIDHIGRLARLALTPDEKASYAAQLGEVLAHIEQLRQVDVSGVEPTAHAFAVTNVWREDLPGPALPVEAALRNAPAQRARMVVVPKVVE